ncbi:MAG: uracil-DNA glycosylase [Burkholderiales bacterium]|nr:uracil-DNA glycosylase [Burkholderiales bacterium]
MGLRVWGETAPEHALATSDAGLEDAAAPASPSDPDPAPPRPAAPERRRAPAPQADAASPPPRASPAIDLGAVAAMEWPALREAVAACRACDLCQTRTQTVFGVGHARAHWMVVGEAPGEQEDRQGEPFVGAAGQLLDRMLAALQLSRADDGDAASRVYIANTLKCRPPRNRNPSAEELHACEPFLVRQIELLRPRIILAMGRFAVQALLRSDEPVGKLRGRVHRYQGVPLVVTYHPAYLLRNLPDKARAWEDLCLAAGVAEAAAEAAG